jgi:hypothetical protein
MGGPEAQGGASMPGPGAAAPGAPAGGNTNVPNMPPTKSYGIPQAPQ